MAVDMRNVYFEFPKRLTRVCVCTRVYACACSHAHVIARVCVCVFKLRRWHNLLSRNIDGAPNRENLSHALTTS